MNQGASGSGSSSQKSDCEGSTSEDLERSLDDESFKGVFTNALQHSLFIYKNNNLVTENPPQNISSVSKTMAEKISEAVIDVVNECQVSVEEQLTLELLTIEVYLLLPCQTSHFDSPW